MPSWPTKCTAAAATGLALFALACGDHGSGGATGPGPPKGLASCNSAPFLSVPLVPIGNIRSISPLGNLNPPSHTFPTDHIYLYMSVFAPIAAPGAIVVTNVLVQHRSGGGQPAFDDYAVTFFPCADVMVQLGHVASLSAQLSSQVGTIDGECFPASQTGGFTYQQCRKSVSIAMAAGDVIGMTAGTLDVLARDRRVSVSYVNPSRASDPVGEFGDKHVSCAIDYFIASIGDPMRAKLGNPPVIRTTPPVCGEVMQDAPGTAAGRWFRGASPTYPEDPHLALVHDNIAPGLGAFSVGTSIPSLPTGVYTFTPAASGRVNLYFRFVTTVGEIECYAVSRNQRVLLQLASPTRVRVEGIGPGACGDPGGWVMGAGAVDFDR